MASTMDEAHALAADGVEAGTVVLASAQSAGRGRSGRSWMSEPGGGLWFTVIERPEAGSALDVLALRVGLGLSQALSGAVHGAIGLKWPNDLYVGPRKLAGILIEVRWREQQVEWVAIGVGINRRIPDDVPFAAAVRPDITRDELLQLAVPAVRAAARAGGPLTDLELAAWRARDIAVGRRVREPRPGVVQGITPQGALVVIDEHGTRGEVVSGSLVFAD